jgi:DNA-binding beta-propeller fold protein YncE
MKDRFDFLEIGDEHPQPAPPANTPAGQSWKPLRLKAVEVIGEPGTMSGQFNMPTGLAVDRDGTLYVADLNNHRVQRIGLNGDLKVFGRPGNANGEMWGPMAVAVAPGGQFFYVAEQGNHRLQCFHFLGQYRSTISGFRGPSGLAFDAEGMLWIADTGNARLLRFNVRTNQFLRHSLERVAGITRPLAVTCDSVRRIYVTDGATNNVIRFDTNGVCTLSLAENRRLAAPRGIAVDAQGRIYVAEAEANRLHVFDAEGQSLVTFDTPSSKLGSFHAPSAVALGPNGDIYVADTLNHRILRLVWVE